jgi:hypothetical protein
MKLVELYKHYSHRHPETVRELDDQHTLYEGLAKSYSPEQLISLVKKIDKGIKINYDHRQFSVLDIIFITPVDIDIIERVLQIVTTCGWFVAMTTAHNNRGLDVSKNNVQDILPHITTFAPNTQIQLIIEAKYGVDVTQRMLRQPWLFHVTPTQSVDKILKIGLTPKTRAKLAAHPERIYLATSETSAKFIENAFRKETQTDDWTILKIDTGAFERIGRLFVDPAFAGEGVFTLSNIAPHFISKL